MVSRFFESILALNEEKDKNGKYVQFKRYIDKEAGNKKFSVPLNDKAKRGHHIDDISEGYYFTNDYDTETGDAENRTWYEIIDVDTDDNGGNVYLVPVDEFGNKLTLTQIKKRYPQYTSKMEKYGYCTSEYIENGESNFLVVPTEYVYNDNYSKVLGREIERFPGEKYMFDYDDNGDIIPNDLWKEKHPDIDFDADFDDNYDARHYHSNQFRGKKLPLSGNFRARQDYEDAENAFKRANDAKKARSFSGVRMHSPWGGFTSEFIKANPGFKDLPKEDQEFFEKEFSNQCYPTGSRGSMSIREFKKWCTDRGINWKSVERAMQNSSSDFAEAYSNS